VHSSTLLLNKRAYQLDIFLIAIGSISYLILFSKIIWEFIINIYAIIINTPLIHVSLAAGLCSFILHLVFILCTEVLKL